MIVNLYVSRDGQQYGPYSLEEAREHLASGGLLPTDYAYHEGMAGWAPLAEVLATQPQPTSPVAYATPATTTPFKAKKSRGKKSKLKEGGKATTVGAGAILQKYKAVLAAVVIIATGIFLYTNLKNTNPSQGEDTKSKDAGNDIEEQMGQYEKGGMKGGNPVGPAPPGGTD